MQCFPVKSLVHKVLGGGGVYAYIRYLWAPPKLLSIIENVFGSQGVDVNRSLLEKAAECFPHLLDCIVTDHSRHKRPNYG